MSPSSIVKARSTYGYHLDALVGEFLGGITIHFPGHAADGPLVLELGVVEEGLHDGASLLAGGPEDGDDFLARHFSFFS